MQNVFKQSNQVAIIPQLYEDFTSLLHEYSLFQMVSEPTRGDNTLHLFLKSNPTLVNELQIKPGLADHDVMVTTVNLKPKVTRQIPRNVPLYRKADWVSFKAFMSEAASDILSNFQDKSVEEIWSAFKSYIHSGIKKFIPVKKIGSKRTQ